MRDFRDAKTMARTLRSALAAKDLKISNSQSLELVAKMFGIADWNTLSAAIHEKAQVARKGTSSPSPVDVKSDPVRPLSAEFKMTLRRALDHANQRKHEYATLEHLLLSLADDADVAAMMNAFNADLGALKENLISYLDNELKKLVVAYGGDSNPSPAFNRVVQRAALHAQKLGHPEVMGSHALVGISSEWKSPAAQLLGEQGLTKQDVMNLLGNDSG